MTRSRLHTILIGVFLAAFIVFLAIFNAMKPRILVLHSYGAESPWSQRVNSGIQQILKKNRTPVTVRYHYLGLESSLDPNRVRNAVNDAHRAIALQRPDLVIAVDDESNQHVVRDYAGKDRPKIVYVATLLSPDYYGYDTAGNASGIQERLPLDAVRETILVVRKGKAARIAVLAMDDLTGQAELEQVTAYHWGSHRLVATKASNSFHEWQQFIQNQADQADLLLVLSYDGLVRSSQDRQTVPHNEIAAWIEKNAKPLPIGLDTTYTEDGGGLSITPAPGDFGEKAMTMALHWLSSPKGTAPPEAMNGSPHFKVGIRNSLLEARGIELPAIYLEAARVNGSLLP